MLITRSTEAEAKTEKQEQSLGPYNNNITFYSHIYTVVTCDFP